MKIKNLLTAPNIKRLACVYFVGLATINLTLTWYDYGFKSADLITLVLAALPFIVNKKLFYLLYGLLAAFISVYLMFACLVYALKSEVTATGADAFMGFVLTFTTLLFSIGLMYLGMQSSDKDRFSLI